MRASIRYPGGSFYVIGEGKTKQAAKTDSAWRALVVLSRIAGAK